MPLQVAFIPIARPTFDTELAADVTAQARQTIQNANLTLLGLEQLVMDESSTHAAIEALRHTPLDLLILFQASFADATVAVNIATALPDVPLLLWAVPDVPTGGRLRLNSLCGINLAAFSLRQIGRHFRYLHVEADAASANTQIKPLAQAGRAVRLLRQAKVGVIGQHPTGFDPCRYDNQQLKDKFGVEVKPFALSTFFEQIKQQPAEKIDHRLQQFGAAIPNLPDLDPTAVQGTARTFEALNELSTTEQLTGLAVRCWPEFFTENGCAACGAMSMMSNQGIPCSCEADVNGTTTSLLLQGLSDTPVFLTDLVSANAEEDTVAFWHCGLAPLSMADPEVMVQGTIHSNRKLPLLMEFPLKPGPVTIARLTQSGNNGYRLVIGRGEMLKQPLPFSGTSGTCRFHSPVPQVLEVIMNEGLDHHYSITYGDYYEALFAVAEMLELPVVRLTD